MVGDPDGGDDLVYDEHYRYRCKQLTGRELDEKGKLVIYPANTLEAHWNARNPTSVIAGLRRVSKPGLRVYAKSTNLPKVLGGLGIAIISTSQGLLTDRQAKKNGVGGEVLAYVW